MSSAQSSESSSSPEFRSLALSAPVLDALNAVGYESPSPIQAATIPPLLDGRDVIGQAQTGTGKTAAFALPILSRLKPSRGQPQALVLAPTRELAIQVAEAFQRYAVQIDGFHVLPIYGGQSYGPQLSALRRGVHVVVGTPGRVMDHVKRGTLKLAALDWLVLDEADEMLRMGFIDDVEWIFEQTPPARQVALFSATMPAAIRRIARTHLKDPAEVTIKARTSTATNIRQRYWLVSGVHKLDALTRLLEAEPFDGMLVFTRTKKATEELAERLEARGFASAALNGDIAQPQRERTVARFKQGEVDILVATDVAARGLDVERISHVINYDIPYDTESYVHRIGRTGRAGRSGEAILFVTPRERRLLSAIEKATRQRIERMELPSVETVNDHRIARFKQRISDTLAADDLKDFKALVDQYEREHDVPASDIAAALASLMQGDEPLLLKPPKPMPPSRTPAVPAKNRRAAKSGAESKKSAGLPSEDVEMFRVEVGHEHGVKPGNIVGAIANEAGLDSRHIGRIDIRSDHSLVELPRGMPKEVFNDLKKAWVVSRQLRITRVEDGGAPGEPPKKIKSRRPSTVKPKKKAKKKDV